MRYLSALRSFAALAAIMTSSAAFGDDDIKFVYDVCLHEMATEPSVPRSESEAFCSCAADEVKKAITQGQRSSIRDARNRMRLGQPVPPDIFQKSGLTTLIGKSQEYCMNSQWPQPPTISDKDHKKYSSMANQSVDEFTALLDTRCEKYPKSKERSQCLVDASKEWLETKGRQYVGIPHHYVTGNDLAKTFIENGR